MRGAFEQQVAMTLFLYSIAFTALVFAALKVTISFLRRAFPEGRALFEAVENYVWVPAALLGLMLTTFITRFVR